MLGDALARGRGVCAGIGALCVVLVALMASPGVALATGSGYYVTFVARSCPSYQDVFANKVRNNVQESLEDLGPRSPYHLLALVDPLVESRRPQRACSPLPGWEFTLGRGYETRAVTGPWGSLSKVTDPFSRAPIVTEVSTPFYNQHHHRLDHLSIAGATTIQLTREERRQASRRDQLWAQGGTPEDPALAQRFPGPAYGFAAIRCATDAMNGDNVEYIFFPAGVTHVFCYAFYAVPPPTSGTITIETRVDGAPLGENPSFAFNGSISFDPEGFTLADGQSQDFVRAGGQTWDVTEAPVTNYLLSSVQCTARTASGRPGASTATVTGSTAVIQLVADEHVTCIYTNAYQPPPGGLTITKISRGGVGRFGYTIAPAAVGATRHAAARTQTPGVPADARPALTDLPPGPYTITERSPTTGAGRWRTTMVSCDGVRQELTSAIHVRIRSGRATTCVFRSAFIPAGSISLGKITTGSTGTVGFLIAAQTGQPRQYRQHATTASEGVVADAVSNGPGNGTDHLRLGRYLIGEQAPPSEDPESWMLQSVECNGEVVPFDRGLTAVTLTAAHPSVHCVFADRFTAHPTPPPLPPPTPAFPPASNPAVSPYPTSDLTVAKQALDPFAVAGQPVTYRITVHDDGPDTAADAVLVDQPRSKATVVFARPSRGHCTIGALIVCRLGNIGTGATVSIMVRLIPTATVTPFVNRAVAGGATSESTLDNNVSHSTIRVVVPPAHPVACPSRVAQVARVAC